MSRHGLQTPPLCCTHQCREGRACPARKARLALGWTAAVMRFFRLMPVAFERAHLLWAQREIHPLHPDVGYVQRRLRELEDRRRG